MNNPFILSFLTSIITASISGIISYLVTSKKCKSDIEKLKVSHQNKINEITKNFENEISKLELLHKQNLDNSQNQIINDLVYDIFKKELSKELNIIRVRTGYADKGIKISLDLLNHIALQGKFDNDILFDTKDYKSRIYNLSEQRIQALIEHYDQKKKDRQLESEE